MKHRTLHISIALLGGLALTLAPTLLVDRVVLVQADHSVLYVAPGGDCGGASPCYATIQAAVDAASDGDVIKVAAGVYTDLHARSAPPEYPGPSVVTQVVYISKSITIRGGYTMTNWTTSNSKANPTTLEARGQGRVLYITDDIGPTIEGLRITRGNADRLGGGYFEFDCGGGIYLYYASSDATLRNNQVFSNTAGIGGGLCLYYGAATVNGNEVFSNTAGSGGGLWLDRSEATLSGNTIFANTASSVGGGGVYLLWGGADTLVGNTIVSNTAEPAGGGVYLDASEARLEGNIIRGNTAGLGGTEWWEGGGGLHLRSSDATLINNVIADNRASPSGSGVKIRGGSPRLLHNTIARNSGGDGSGVYVRHEGSTYGTVALTNTMLVSHTVGIGVAGGNTVTVNGVLWYGTPFTVSQVATAVVTLQNQHQGAPAFTADGYHLTSGSAAIDRGVDAGVRHDIDNQPRPYQNPDLGADEYWPPGALKYVYLPLVMRDF